jgi:hypothetical protein
MVGISAWIVLSLPVGLLIGAMARTGRRAPRRPGPAPVALPVRAAVVRPGRAAALALV